MPAAACLPQAASSSPHATRDGRWVVGCNGGSGQRRHCPRARPPAAAARRRSGLLPPPPNSRSSQARVAQMDQFNAVWTPPSEAAAKAGKLVPRNRLQGRLVVVGGASGIVGSGITRQLLMEGAKVRLARLGGSSSSGALGNAALLPCTHERRRHAPPPTCARVASHSPSPLSSLTGGGHAAARGAAGGAAEGVPGCAAHAALRTLSLPLPLPAPSPRVPHRMPRSLWHDSTASASARSLIPPSHKPTLNTHYLPSRCRRPPGQALPRGRGRRVQGGAVQGVHRRRRQAARRHRPRRVLLRRLVAGAPALRLPTASLGCRGLLCRNVAPQGRRQASENAGGRWNPSLPALPLHPSLDLRRAAC